jgi:hypothetical protein
MLPGKQRRARPSLVDVGSTTRSTAATTWRTAARVVLRPRTFAPRPRSNRPRSRRLLQRNAVSAEHRPTCAPRPRPRPRYPRCKIFGRRTSRSTRAGARRAAAKERGKGMGVGGRGAAARFRDQIQILTRGKSNWISKEMRKDSKFNEERRRPPILILEQLRRRRRGDACSAAGTWALVVINGSFERCGVRTSGGMGVGSDVDVRTRRERRRRGAAW